MFRCGHMQIFLVVIILSSVRSSTNRVKRIVYGKPVDENSDYTSPRYVASIHYAHYCKHPQFSDIKPDQEGVCPRSSVSHICSGSLLTPSLVQTNCHCVASFGTEREGYQQPTVFSVWEHLFAIYIGAITNEQAPASTAKTYIHHHKCSAWGIKRIILHDYGLIILKTAVKCRKDNLAPLYSTETLASLWMRIMSRQTVCLNVGFGTFRIVNNQMDPTPSSVLRHCWMRTWDYLSCYRNMSLPFSHAGALFNYKNDATWFCSSRVSGQLAHPGWGDSGGPVACDNEYVGLHHQSVSLRSIGQHVYSSSMSISFTAYENSAGFRQSLLVFLQLFDSYGEKTSSPQLHQ